MVADNRPEIATKIATKWRWPARRSVDSALDAQPSIRNHRPAYQLGSEPSPPDGFDLQGPQVMGPPSRSGWKLTCAVLVELRGLEPLTPCMPYTARSHGRCCSEPSPLVNARS
jgi:hypothetical protein